MSRKAEDKGFSPSLDSIPADVFNGVLTFLGEPIAAHNIAQCSKRHAHFFKNDSNSLGLHQFLQLVARGQQQEAEVLLIADAYRLPIQKIKEILKAEMALAEEKGLVIITLPKVQEKLKQEQAIQLAKLDSKSGPVQPVETKNDGSSSIPHSELLLQKSFLPILDWAGKETGEVSLRETALQNTLKALDFPMYRMLLHFMPASAALEQWDELEKAGKIQGLNYELCTMSDEIDRLEVGKLYIRQKDGELTYSVVTLYGEEVRDVIVSKEHWAALEEKSEVKCILPDFTQVKELKDNEYKVLQARILQIASRCYHTDISTESLMTPGRAKIEKVKHCIKTYVDQNVPRAEEYRYWSEEVGGAQRHLPPWVIHVYCREDTESLDCKQDNLPRTMTTLSELCIYPLISYSRALVVNAEDKIPIDQYALVLQWDRDKKGATLVARTGKDQTAKFCLHRRDMDKLRRMGLPESGEIQNKDLIQSIVKHIDGMTLGATVGLIRKPGGAYCIPNPEKKRIIVHAWHGEKWEVGAAEDLAELTQLCKRSQDNLKELHQDLLKAQAQASCSPASR